MKKSQKIIFNFQFSIFNCLLCFILFGCIEEYEPTGIEEIADILVVEGIITDDESYITLSKSMFLSQTDWGNASSYFITNARVYVECREDETSFIAEPPDWDWRYWPPRYLIKTGKLDFDKQYRLKIEIDEYDYESEDCYWDWSGWMNCPSTTYEYYSDYSFPIRTPEIDSIFWTKRGRGQPVMVYVATQSRDNQAIYYRWSFKEDWEINSFRSLEGYNYNCWFNSRNFELLVGSSEKSLSGKLMQTIIEIPPTNSRLSVLYRIDVMQNAISKRAYDYFTNIKKNTEQTSGLFVPIPSELRGNITCYTDPNKPVIGYIDVSSTTQKRHFISRYDNLYEPSLVICNLILRDSMLIWYGLPPWPNHVLYDREERLYSPIECVECTLLGGHTIIPDNWPIIITDD